MKQSCNCIGGERLLKVLFLALFSICSMPMLAQEYATREVVPFEADAVKDGVLIDVTKELSTVEYNYFNLFYHNAYAGDYIAGISFYGYNPGKELKRHLKVWMREQDHRGTDWVCVYDGDIMIPAGGSSDEPVSLIKADFEETFRLKSLMYFCLKIECSGEIGEEPLCFEYNTEKNSPVARYAVMSEVKFLSGTVKNIDGQPIKDAHVRLYNLMTTAEGVTDTDGVYHVRVEQSNVAYQVSVEAQRYATYRIESAESAVRLKDAGTMTERDFVLYDKVTYKKDRRATIILPVAPNPDWGRYYRLDRREGAANFYFEREETPQANVPYVIFPNRDFELNVGDYDLQQEPGKTVAPFPEERSEYLESVYGILQYATLYGSYQSVDITGLYDGEICYFLDTTPDCDSWMGRIGACRAYLRMISPGRETPNMIFANEPTGITERTDAMTDNNFYDLQGRRLTDRPVKGLYIRGGKKYMVK